MMALNLSTNLNHEMMRLALAAEGLTSAEIEDLLPRDTMEAAPPLPELASLYPLQRQGGRQKHAARAPVEDFIGGGAPTNLGGSGQPTPPRQPPPGTHPAPPAPAP